MAGYGDILDSFISGQNQALANQLNLTRLEETQRQNRIRNEQFNRQFDADEAQRKITNAYNQGILETQQNADARAQTLFDEETKLAADQNLIRLANQQIDLTQDVTVQQALDPNNAFYFQTLANISGVRDRTGGEVKAIERIPGTERSPRYIVRLFNDTTGTEGPVTENRGTGGNERVMVFTEEGINRFLNDARKTALARVNAIGRPAAEALSKMDAAARAGERATAVDIETGSGVKPIESYAMNAPSGDQSGMAGVGPVGTGQPYQGTVAQGNAVAAAAPLGSSTNAASTAAAPATSSPAQSNAALAQIDTDLAALRNLRQMYVQGSAGVAQGPGGMYGGVNAQPGPRVQEVDQEIAALEAQKAQMLGNVPQQSAAPASQATGALPSTTATQPAANQQTQVSAPQLGAPAMGNYLMDGMGTQQRITNLVSSLTAPYVDTAKSAASAYNAAADYTGRTATPEQLQLISFLEQTGQITPESASALRSTGTFDPASVVNTRMNNRMTNSRAILTNAQDNQRAVTTSVIDNEQQIVTGAQTQAGTDNRKRMDVYADLQKKAMDIQADLDKNADKRTRDAYGFIEDTIAPSVMDNFSVPNEDRPLLTSVVTNVWATMPRDIPDGKGGSINLRSTDPGVQRTIANGTVKAYRELKRYDEGGQLAPDGVLDWFQDVVWPDKFRDWGRTDLNTNEINGLTLTALGLSGLRADVFADIVLEPMAAKNSNLPPAKFKRLLTSIVLFEGAEGRPPTETDIRFLVADALGEN